MWNQFSRLKMIFFEYFFLFLIKFRLFKGSWLNQELILDRNCSSIPTPNTYYLTPQQAHVNAGCRVQSLTFYFKKFCRRKESPCGADYLLGSQMEAGKRSRSMFWISLRCFRWSSASERIVQTYWHKRAWVFWVTRQFIPITRQILTAGAHAAEGH